MFERSVHGKLRVKFEKISDVVALDRDFVSQSGGGQNQTFEVLNN